MNYKSVANIGKYAGGLFWAIMMIGGTIKEMKKNGEDPTLGKVAAKVGTEALEDIKESE